MPSWGAVKRRGTYSSACWVSAMMWVCYRSNTIPMPSGFSETSRKRSRMSRLSTPPAIYLRKQVRLSQERLARLTRRKGKIKRRALTAVRLAPASANVSDPSSVKQPRHVGELEEITHHQLGFRLIRTSPILGKFSKDQ